MRILSGFLQNQVEAIDQGQGQGREADYHALTERLLSLSSAVDVKSDVGSPPPSGNKFWPQGQDTSPCRRVVRFLNPSIPNLTKPNHTQPHETSPIFVTVRLPLTLLLPSEAANFRRAARVLRHPDIPHLATELAGQQRTRKSCSPGRQSLSVAHDVIVLLCTASCNEAPAPGPRARKLTRTPQQTGRKVRRCVSSRLLR